MNKLTKVETLYVPRDENDTALVHYTKKVYDTLPNGFKLISDVKEQNNRYILSEEELIEFGSNFFRQGERYGRYDIKEIETGEKNLTLDLPEYIKEILNNE